MKSTGTAVGIIALFAAAYFTTLGFRKSTVREKAFESPAEEADKVLLDEPPFSDRELAALSDAPPPVASPAEAPLKVTVYTESGPLSGARVEAAGMVGTSHGKTGTNGTVLLEVTTLPNSEYRSVRAEAEGLHPGLIHIPIQERDANLLLLPPCSISGRVQTTAGSAPEVEVTVLAWKVWGNKEFPASSIFSILRDGHIAEESMEGAVRFAKASADGSFQLDGLERGVRYFLAAGGNGWASLVTTVGTPASDPVLLTVQGVFGARLVVRGDDGAPLELSPTLARSVSKSWGSHDPGAVVCDTAELAAALAGLPPEESVNTPSRITCMFLSDSLMDRVGPCVAYYSLPGYQSAEVEFFPTSTTNGLVEYSLEMKAWTDERGEIELIPSEVPPRVSTSFQDAKRFSEVLDSFVLELTSGAQMQKTMTLGVELKLDTSMLVSDVPVGAYEFRLRSLHKLFYYPEIELPAGRVQVLSGQVARIEMDASSWTTLTVQFLASDGSEYLGPAEFTVAKGMAPADGTLRGSRRVRFDNGPYVVGMVNCGDYSMRVWNPEIRDERDEHGIYTIGIASGQPCRTVLSLVH